MSKYYEVSIIPASNGIGEHECQPINGDGWDDADDLLTEIMSNNDHVFELSDDDADIKPGQIEDIRGMVRNEPERVFGVVHTDNSVSYFGITSI